MKIDKNGNVQGINLHKEISLLGLILSILGFITFTWLFFSLIGWLAFMVSPIVSLMAFRPVDAGGCWMWEKWVKQI